MADPFKIWQSSQLTSIFRVESAALRTAMIDFPLRW
jgi:hypothetical protein